MITIQRLLLLSFLIIPASLMAQPQTVALKPVLNYTLDSKVQLSNGMNFMVVTNEPKFNKMFGITKNETVRADKPDFATQEVLIAAMPAGDKEISLKFDRAIKSGDKLEVYITKSVFSKVTYTVNPLGMVAIPKDKTIKTVLFYEGGRMVQEVKVK